ncbi:transcriptional regulator [Latilactobacillus curvatus]|uniref:Transcriptional regulator n=1 Tax=Latilactobacillus curvatus TaxID=28038 RepID=A0AAC9UNJ3_LATCU|nr:helix-turn-helix transcriptional regulator [Latilactobacillus curvatus]ASN59796.1 transcriptional regulator [Latilactobacillus curvatus]
MKNDADLISSHLLSLLQERNLTVNRIATLAGLRQSTVNAMFDGSSKRPTISTIRKLCNALGISVQDFFDFPPYNEVEK